jgi:hypothetical protein
VRILRCLGLCALLLGSVACTRLNEVLDKVVLTDAELELVGENYAGALRAYYDIEQFAIDVANGDVDVGDALTFTAPDAANNWTGTISYLGPDLPGGDGELVVTFRVLSDGVAVDPFAADLTGADVLAAEMTVEFDGHTKEGVPMTLSAAFTTSYDRTFAEGQVEISTNGTFDIDHGGYTAALTATDFAFVVDTATAVAQSASGRVSGAMDIPDYTFDADVNIEGQGDIVRIDVHVLDQEIDKADIAVADF